MIGQYSPENENAYYLFYIVSKRFNNLLPLQNSYNYSEKQIANYKLTKSLHKSGFGYKKMHNFQMKGVSKQKMIKSGQMD